MIFFSKTRNFKKIKLKKYKKYKNHQSLILYRISEYKNGDIVTASYVRKVNVIGIVKS